VIDSATGKKAATDFALLERYHSQASLISASPHTGFTHQIRAHLRHLGFPILSDPLYYSQESRAFSAQLPIKRTSLHAHSLSFFHPTDNQTLRFTAPLPDDFLQTVEFLNQKGAS